MGCKTISELLSREFSNRKQRNASYSLRAFARDLRLSPSRLCEVMKGKEGLSESTATSVAESLGRKPKERDFIKDLVLAEFSRNEKVRETARKRLHEARNSESFKRLQTDQFQVIAEWHHGAILELINVKDFQSDPAWIARRLGISAQAASEALARLESLGLILKGRGGNWQAKPEAYSAFSELPSTAIRKFHRDILAKHTSSLREDPMLDREHLSMILAVPRSKLPHFKEEMRKFMTSFWQAIEDDEKDDLYSISLQLCPVRNRNAKGDSSAN